MSHIESLDEMLRLQRARTRARAYVEKRYPIGGKVRVRLGCATIVDEKIVPPPEIVGTIAGHYSEPDAGLAVEFDAPDMEAANKAFWVWKLRDGGFQIHWSSVAGANQ